MFFFIDRDIIDEPQLDGLDDVVLSYTFFKWVSLRLADVAERADEGKQGSAKRQRPRGTGCARGCHPEVARV